MRVAFALGGTDYGRSGIGTYVRSVAPRMIAALNAAGGQLVALGDRRELDVYASMLTGAELVELPTFLSKPAFNAAFYLLGSGEQARRAKADVLLLPAANRRTAALSSVPTVAVVHDLGQLHVEGKYDALRMAYLKYIVIGALKRADQLVAISQSTAKDLRDVMGSDGPPITVVPNGVDAARFLPPTENDPRVAAARASIGVDGPYLLYSARLEHPGKNHLRLIEAFAKSKAARGHTLVLCGGDWGARMLIDETIRKCKLGDRVRITGYVDEAILPGLFAGAEAVAMVGLAEGFGLPALESLAAGRPVVTATTGALPEVVGDLGAMCDPYNVDSIASAIDRSLTDRAYRARALNEGPSHAASRDWSKTAHGLIDVCRRALR
jgi:glycosyltransferase involved in cell wall biosynthesis